MEWAENGANYPLPGYILESIRASWDTRTYRTELEMNMADRHTDMVQAANHWINWLYRDTLPPPPDTVQHVWKRIRTNAARYAEAALLIGHGQLDEAKDIMLDMPLERELNPVEYAERGRMLGYIGILDDAQHDGRSAYQLSSTEVTQLKTLIGVEYDRPSVWVRNLLCAVYNDCMPPYTGGEAEPKSARRPQHEQRPVATPNNFSLQPNPARNWVAFNYALYSPTDQGRVVVRDLSGRVLETIRFNGQEGQRMLDTRNMVAGVYTVEFFDGVNMLHTEKLIVQP